VKERTLAGHRTFYALLRIAEGASIPELAEELGHSPRITLSTYAHVIDELRALAASPARRSPDRGVERNGSASALRGAGGGCYVRRVGFRSART
jgi:hypothetical protein